MYFTVYQITNNLNNKIYVGMHQTEDLDDEYMGSGIAIQRAYTKYGKEHFTKKILYIFDSRNEMMKKEIEIVSESFVRRIDTYNIKLGGIGGNEPGHMSKEGYERMMAANKNKIISKETRKKMSIAHKGFVQTNEHIEKRATVLRGIKRGPRSDEWSRKISESLKGRNAWNKGIKQETVKCPHCNKKGGPPGIYRWHFENCRDS